MHGKKVLLIIGGGIAAYKTLDLIRLLKKRGAKVTAVLTKSAEQFVTPLSVSTLCEEACHTELFDLKNETEIGHIQLSRQADLVLVAPATANLMAKMTNGIADDLATTLLLATDKTVLIAPAMNVRMWQHPATQRNIIQLKKDQVAFIGPESGDMACGEFGPGRMTEPQDIVTEIEHYFAKCKDELLFGRHVLVTSGPTQEPIDPVRYISNRSSGKQGYAIAASAAELGAKVTLVSGPTKLPAPEDVELIRVETAEQMLAACKKALPADIAVCAAAVADWRVADLAENKIKKTKTTKSPPLLELVENPDILKILSKTGAKRPSLVIGFAAETENLLPNAMKKRKDKGCDWIVANNVSEENDVFEGDNNEIHLVTKSETEDWPHMHKQKVADLLMRKASEFLSDLKN